MPQVCGIFTTVKSSFCHKLLLNIVKLLGETWINKEKLGETKMSLWQNLVFFLVIFGVENGLVGCKSNF